MSRVQLALNVSDLEDAIAFYSRLLGAEPAKVRPGYANFAVADPPLKLVLVEQPGAGGTLNHLGVEVPGPGDVAAAAARLAGEGLDPVGERGECCYALQEKVWVHGPDGEPWEVYTVLADAEHPAGSLRPDPSGSDAPGSCCVNAAGAPAGDADRVAPACCP